MMNQDEYFANTTQSSFLENPDIIYTAGHVNGSSRAFITLECSVVKFPTSGGLTLVFIREVKTSHWCLGNGPKIDTTKSKVVF